LPALNDLGRRFARKGIAVLAVNIGEDRDTYQRFIADHSYESLIWALDASREIVGMYQVRSIPTTYLIDGESVIRHTHIGYGTSTAELMRQEIESLLQ